MAIGRGRWERRRHRRATGKTRQARDRDPRRRLPRVGQGCQCSRRGVNAGNDAGGSACEPQRHFGLLVET